MILILILSESFSSKPRGWSTIAVRVYSQLEQQGSEENTKRLYLQKSNMLTILFRENLLVSW